MKKILESKRVSEIMEIIDDFGLWSFIATDSDQPITTLTPQEILTQI